MAEARPKLVLASGSPRRKELLETIGLEFDVVVSEVDETVEPSLPPAIVVQTLAERKASAVARRLAAEATSDAEAGRTLIIASDTIVTIEGRILGKPVDRAHAAAMLRRLESRTHTVVTGLCVLDADSGQKEVGFSATDVTFRPLTEDEIERYINTGEPMDKAGAYGIQGIGSTLVTKIAGDYFTVVGLPLHLLATYLKTFDLNVF